MRTLRARALHDQVIAEIGKRIVSGEFAEGVALPGEASLCSGLGVSRTALREALRVLASKGLVEPRRKTGTRVCPSGSWSFLDADVLAWQLEVGDSDRIVSELYELRHLIEPIAAALAARRARPADLQALRQAYDEMREAGDDGERIAGPDLAFHRAIITASGNRLFSSLSPVIGAALSVNFKLISAAPRGHTHSMPAHKKVLNAIENGDASAARVAMQQLIEDSQRDARAVRAAKTRRRYRVIPRTKAGG